MYKIEKIEGGVCAASGFFADGISAGLKPNGARDMAYIYSDTLCEIAATFTTNKMAAAPIEHFKAKGEFQTNFVLINSKNANAMTGKKGVQDIEEILAHLPETMRNPVMSSTGVIGVALPKAKIIEGIKQFDFSKKDAAAAAEAIMTTDSFKKEIAYKVTLDDGSSFHVGAMAKGAGMINPAMATMLCFITTDADVPFVTMQKLLDLHVKDTFNAASVDGDTSTNDTVMLLSNKKSNTFDEVAFSEVLFNIMEHMAKQMVKDGEGATKLVTYEISGARNDDEAEIVAKALSNSLLVKTALYGEDPNWGRIASTIGASGVEASQESITISFGDVCVYDKGNVYFDEENEKKAAAVMKQDEFSIYCDLGVGVGSYRAFGCDLGHKYVEINADYRT